MDEGQHEVRDGQRTLKFTGVQLAHTTSEKAHKDRWAEIWIYRTTAGQYVTAGVGRSRVRGETDRFWAQVSEGAHAVVERLQLFDDDGAKYLPFTSREALEQAAVDDDGIREAYAVEYIE